MDFAKQSRILMVIGGVGVVISLIWAASVTLTLLPAVSWAHQTFPEVFARVLSTWPDEGFVGYSFNPTVFWASAGVLAGGFVMMLSLKNEKGDAALNKEKT